jgi:hypothetical protein
MMAKFGKYTGFGTWKLEVDGDLYYFQSIDDMKQWFKQMVKDLVIGMAKNALRVLLNYIPTESGQLAAAIYQTSQYGVMDWKNQIIFQIKVIDPKLYNYVATDGQTKTKKIKNVSHSHSRHKAYRAPDTLLNNPNIHPIGSKGQAYIYDRDDPLATANYLAVMRRFIKDMVATAMIRIMRKTYYVHYYIKVSKNVYGKDMYLNPATPIQKRKTNILSGKIINVIPNSLDEFGSFLDLYNKP